MSPFLKMRDKYPPQIFLDCLFIPITEVTDPTILAGFDVRYVGTEQGKIRYKKFKADPEQPLIYMTHSLEEINSEKPVIITEGAIDAESLRFLGHPVLSPLTAQHNIRWALFLWAVSSRIYIAYDNDEDGKKSTRKLLEHVSIDPKVQQGFKALSYMGVDPNGVLCGHGQKYLETILGAQISERL